jgi:uncharacterized protein YggE
MATITVTGHGSAAGRPDEVVVLLEVAAVEDTAAEAFARVSERSAALEQVCDEYAIAEEARSSTGISVHDHHEYDHDGRARVRQRASNRVSVRLRDPAPLSELLRAAVERAEAHVQGPWWRLADDNPALADARRLAATDAGRRAEAYAGALGLRLGAVEKAVERQTGAHTGVALGFALAAETGPPIHPGELEAAADLEVTYALEGA